MPSTLTLDYAPRLVSLQFPPSHYSTPVPPSTPKPLKSTPKKPLSQNILQNNNNSFKSPTKVSHKDKTNGHDEREDETSFDFEHKQTNFPNTSKETTTATTNNNHTTSYNINKDYINLNIQSPFNSGLSKQELSEIIQSSNFPPSSSISSSSSFFPSSSSSFFSSRPFVPSPTPAHNHLQQILLADWKNSPLSSYTNIPPTNSQIYSPSPSLLSTPSPAINLPASPSVSPINTEESYNLSINNNNNYSSKNNITNYLNSSGRETPQISKSIPRPHPFISPSPSLCFSHSQPYPYSESQKISGSSLSKEQIERAKREAQEFVEDLIAAARQKAKMIVENNI